MRRIRKVEPGTVLFFAYGMFTSRSATQARLGYLPLCHGPAIVTGLRLQFRTHADLEPAEGSKAYGLVWEVTQRDMRRIDQVEGTPTYYNRRGVRLNGTTVGATCYAMTHQELRTKQTPSIGYLKEIWEAYDTEGFPPGAQREFFRALLESTRSGVVLADALKRIGALDAYRAMLPELTK